MNKYTKQYNRLIETRLQLNRKYSVGCGYEKHHIQPKSLGGSNTKANLVVLTPREHCLAHMLLARMYTGESKAKMCFALHSLMKARNKHRESITSREYDNLRRTYLKATADPAYRAYRSEITKKQWTPERKAAVAEKTRSQWRDNDAKRSFFASEEWKTKQSINRSTLWKDPEYQQKQSDKAKAQWAEGGSLHHRKAN